MGVISLNKIGCTNSFVHYILPPTPRAKDIDEEMEEEEEEETVADKRLRLAKDMLARAEAHGMWPGRRWRGKPRESGI